MMIKQSLRVIIFGKEHFDGNSNPIPLYNSRFCFNLQIKDEKNRTF